MPESEVPIALCFYQPETHPPTIPFSSLPSELLRSRDESYSFLHHCPLIFTKGDTMKMGRVRSEGRGARSHPTREEK